MIKKNLQSKHHCPGFPTVDVCPLVKRARACITEDRQSHKTMLGSTEAQYTAVLTEWSNLNRQLLSLQKAWRLCKCASLFKVVTQSFLQPQQVCSCDYPAHCRLLCLIEEDSRAREAGYRGPQPVQRRSGKIAAGGV
jgi:hypothetical protein